MKKPSKIITELARKNKKYTETKNDKNVQIQIDRGELTPEQPGKYLLTPSGPRLQVKWSLHGDWRKNAVPTGRNRAAEETLAIRLIKRDCCPEYAKNTSILPKYKQPTRKVKTDMTRYFAEGNMNNQLTTVDGKCLTLLVIREMKIRVTVIAAC